MRQLELLLLLHDQLFTTVHTFMLFPHPNFLLHRKHCTKDNWTSAFTYIRNINFYISNALKMFLHIKGKISFGWKKVWIIALKYLANFSANIFEQFQGGTLFLWQGKTLMELFIDVNWLTVLPPMNVTASGKQLILHLHGFTLNCQSFMSTFAVRLHWKPSAYFLKTLKSMMNSSNFHCLHNLQFQAFYSFLSYTMNLW